MKIRFLGTGTSTGVPEVGCRCAVCTSADSRDARMRTSVLVDYCGKRLLLDCGPDFRTQMMKVDFRKIDGVLLSHEHYDHVGGLDDLRPFCRFGNVDIYCEPSVASALRQRIPYCFAASPYPGVPKIVLHEISTSIPFQIAGIDIEAVRVWHGKMPIAGYRIGRMAYLTDLSRIDDSELSKLADIELLIIDALRIKPHGSHENLEEALENIKRINARQNYLIHMSHDIGLHQEVAATLPPNTHISYDGLEIELPD